MLPRRLKTGCFILEGLNSFSTVYFFYYFYFFMQGQFGYGNQANLLLAALNGAVYAVMAWQGGKFAQRFGYFTALKVGFGIMCAALAVGSRLHTASGHIIVMAVTVVGMCFTWPTLEALVSEGESFAGVQRMVGIYNMVWAGTGAVAIYNLMEDAATAEISRAQLWQWIHLQATLDDGRPVDRQLYETARADALAEIRALPGVDGARLDQATSLLDQLVLARDFVPFLTIPGYELLD